MNYKEEIEKISSEFKAEFSNVNVDFLNMKIKDREWTIGEHIDHLIKINSTYFTGFQMLKSGKYKLGLVAKSRILGNLMGRTILNSVKTTNNKKQKTFPIWEPSSSKIEVDILQKFFIHQKKLLEQILMLNKAEFLSLNIYSPASNKIFYPLKTAFHIIIEREKRHLDHCRRIKSIIDKK